MTRGNRSSRTEATNGQQINDAQTGRETGTATAIPGGIQETCERFIAWQQIDDARTVRGDLETIFRSRERTEARQRIREERSNRQVPTIPAGRGSMETRLRESQDAHARILRGRKISKVRYIKSKLLNFFGILFGFQCIITIVFAAKLIVWENALRNPQVLAISYVKFNELIFYSSLTLIVSGITTAIMGAILINFEYWLREANRGSDDDGETPESVIQALRNSLLLTAILGLPFFIPACLACFQGGALSLKAMNYSSIVLSFLIILAFIPCCISSVLAIGFNQGQNGMRARWNLNNIGMDVHLGDNARDNPPHTFMSNHNSGPDNFLNYSSSYRERDGRYDLPPSYQEYLRQNNINPELKISGIQEAMGGNSENYVEEPPIYSRF